jgi:hypothetical protein
MRLKKARAGAEEDLLRLVNEGHHALQEIDDHYVKETATNTFDEQAELAAIGNSSPYRGLCIPRGAFVGERSASRFISSVSIGSPFRGWGATERDGMVAPPDSA